MKKISRPLQLQHTTLDDQIKAQLGWDQVFCIRSQMLDQFHDVEGNMIYYQLSYLIASQLREGIK